MEKIYENYSAARDIPDSRDYTAEEIFGEIGGSVQFPESFMLGKAENLNQGNIWACTIFGSSNAYNEKIANAHNDLAKITENDAWNAWVECKKRWASDTQGFVFQSALQVLKDLGLIGAYININTSRFANVERMKEALFVRKSGIATGLGSVNWTKTLQNREYAKGSYDGQGAHIFDIIGWDDKKILPSGKIGAFYVANSWGEGGYFYIAYSDIADLYSQYEFLLTSEQEKFVEAKKKRKNNYLQKAFDAKIWNEERPDDTADAHEIRIMINRALGLRYDFEWLRSSFNYMLEDKISRGKIKLYNEKDKYKIATDEEIAIMFNRAVTRDPNINVEELSREEVAEVIGRDFI